MTHIERAMANIKILQPFVQTAASVFLSESRSVKPAHPDFRLFMSTPLPVPALINGEMSNTSKNNNYLENECVVLVMQNSY